MRKLSSFTFALSWAESGIRLGRNVLRNILRGEMKFLIARFFFPGEMKGVGPRLRSVIIYFRILLSSRKICFSCPAFQMRAKNISRHSRDIWYDDGITIAQINNQTMLGFIAIHQHASSSPQLNRFKTILKGDAVGNRRWDGGRDDQQSSRVDSPWVALASIIRYFETHKRLTNAPVLELLFYRRINCNLP